MPPPPSAWLSDFPLLTPRTLRLTPTASFVGDLVADVNDFKCSAYCTFVKTTYVELRYAMCKTLLGGFLQIGISLFALALCMFAIVVTAMIIKTRLS